MKKLFVLALAAGFLISCGNSGDAADEIKDSINKSTNEKIESIDNAAEQVKDTIKASADSLKDRVEELTEKATDSLKNNLIS